MASGDIFTQQQPKDLTPQNGIFNEVPLVYPVSAGGGVAGVPLNSWRRRATSSSAALERHATDDRPHGPARAGRRPGQLGRRPRRAGPATIKRLAGSGDYTQTGGSTEVTANVTMPATPGQLVTQTIAVAKAAISASLAAGDNVLVQIRRIGTAAADTHQGRVLLTGATVQDT